VARHLGSNKSFKADASGAAQLSNCLVAMLSITQAECMD
jgi:hypothetical protein